MRFGVLALLGVGALALATMGCGDDDGTPPGVDAGGGDAARADGAVGDAGVRTDGAMPPGDAGTPDDGAVIMRCGNSTVEGTEECDDGNMSDDDTCLTTCRFACGDGVRNAIEACDTGIAAGMPGACPTACDDGMACTSDVLVGAGCDVTCMSAAITMPAPGDGCCPPGATASTDSDCTSMCNNGVVEAGETCDTLIAAGMPGAGPTTCNDGRACTTDALSGSACTAMCTATPITMAIDGDGCCPMGATSATDNDCSATCGNGVRDTGEACDTAIAAGMPGACPTTCTDGMACTTDTLVSGGTCAAACAFPAITMPVNGDGCCPMGATSLTDNDCMPVCGNRAVEMGETCDDGNTIAGDGCDAMCRREAAATAFRLNSLTLKDPHAFTRVFVCVDITSQLNMQFRDAITTDTDMPPDGQLDLSIASVFRPLDQAAATNNADLTFPDCTAPIATTMCTLPAGATRTPVIARNMAAGTCLGLLPMTTRASYGAITTPMGPCFVTDATPFTVNVGGVMITLSEAQFAATYSGVPATQLINGLLRGFLSEADANATILPASIAVVGGMTLAAVLAGGMGNCRTGTGSDMDTNAAGTRGWYMYFNFTAVTVPYTEL